MGSYDPHQAAAALAIANHHRLGRAAIRRRVTAGEPDLLADLIAHSPAPIATMPLYDLLRDQHRWGRDQARRLIDAIPASEALTLGAMTVRQRTATVALLCGVPNWMTHPQHRAALAWHLQPGDRLLHYTSGIQARPVAVVERSSDRVRLVYPSIGPRPDRSAWLRPGALYPIRTRRSPT